jgi:hypothetical protein
MLACAEHLHRPELSGQYAPLVRMQMQYPTSCPYNLKKPNVKVGHYRKKGAPGIRINALLAFAGVALFLALCY